MITKYQEKRVLQSHCDVQYYNDKFSNVFKTSNKFCTMWYLPHRQVQMERHGSNSIDKN